MEGAIESVYNSSSSDLYSHHLVLSVIQQYTYDYIIFFFKKKEKEKKDKKKAR